MRPRIRQLAVALGVPASLLAAAWLLHARLARLPPPFHELLPFLPYLALAAALLLALLFNRGRAFFPLLLVALLYRLASTPPAWTWRGRVLDPDALLLGAAFLLPLGVALLALLRERGIVNRHGLARLTLLALPGALLAVLATGAPGTLSGWLQAAPFAAWPWTRAMLTQPVALAFLLGGGLLLGRYAVRRTPLDLGLAAGLGALALALWHSLTPAAAAVFSGTAALLLLVALVQESHRMAYRDDLTGLPGRRALQEALPRLGARYAIAMLDVDHFKRFNDTHGHDVGDQVLKLVASRMLAVGGGGRPYRYGGEEFTVLFPGRSAAQATPHLEALREAIAASSFQLRASDRP